MLDLASLGGTVLARSWRSILIGCYVAISAEVADLLVRVLCAEHVEMMNLWQVTTGTIARAGWSGCLCGLGYWMTIFELRVEMRRVLGDWHAGPRLPSCWIRLRHS